MDEHGSGSNLYEGSSNARGINDAGQLIGTSGNGTVLWTGTTASGMPLNFASGINDTGQVAGENVHSLYIIDLGYLYSSQVAAVWNGTKVTDLPTLTECGFDCSDQALAINNAGQVTGISGGHAALWDGSKVTSTAFWMQAGSAQAGCRRTHPILMTRGG